MGFIRFLGTGTLASGLAIFTSQAFAAPEEFIFDDTHTDILFAVSHLGFSKTYGRFNTARGTVILDREAPENSRVDVTIDAASIDTNHEKRDTHLRNADFFNVAEFPTLTYKSNSVELTDDNRATVHGELTMLGVTRPVPLDVTLVKVGPSPAAPDKTVAGFSAKASLKRSEFGMSYGAPVLGDDVELIFEIDAIKHP